MRSLNLIGALALSTLSVQALAQQSREAAQPAKPKRQTKAEKKAAKRARTAGVAADAKPKCPKCGSAHWLWWNELDHYDGPALQTGVDDTRYPCDACGVSASDSETNRAAMTSTTEKEQK